MSGQTRQINLCDQRYAEAVGEGFGRSPLESLFGGSNLFDEFPPASSTKERRSAAAAAPAAPAAGAPAGASAAGGARARWRPWNAAAFA